ncbi:Alpha/Beta hydrolase protein [Xylogone sp. PMI_703]|nr:Alpha/Beta hydrolase protein [Xylogone sp. PMI_703]
MLRLGSIAVLYLFLSRVTGILLHDGSDLIVRTNSFSVKGLVSPNSTDVRIFKGVPYAEPPVGPRRFRPPVAKAPTPQLIDATEYSPICWQLGGGTPNVYTLYITGDEPYPNSTQSEDCLFLNIWAPRAHPGVRTKHAVIIWIHGGGFINGASSEPYNDASEIIANHQDTILVSINYRLNIFGYPNSPEISGRNANPGLLDQRQAVQWVYENIAAFGGDPERMVLGGQSAGAFSVDIYSYAWRKKPLVKGFISESGVMPSNVGVLAAEDPQGTNFTYVAKQLGCPVSSHKGTFECMQTVEARDIATVVNEYNATINEGKSLSFIPVVDNVVTFENYTERVMKGLYAKGGYLTGNNENEGASLVAFNPAGVNETSAQIETDTTFDCPTELSTRQVYTRYRSDRGTAQWRYWFRGNYSNTTPFPWLGAYHSSEIPIIWGTASIGGPDTPAEAATSRYMMGAWTAFAADPLHGLSNYGWPRYHENKPTLVELGYENSTTATFGYHDIADANCP